MGNRLQGKVAIILPFTMSLMRATTERDSALLDRSRRSWQRRSPRTLRTLPHLRLRSMHGRRLAPCALAKRARWRRVRGRRPWPTWW